ncbi:VWA domain-containing protein [Chryseobacterium chendengshani]|uniref:type VI secretion system protein TssR domain-containing protein n=1 Tax=Chryseobacterium sp. LJ668 TaxID=2864040 RepID=UPI001C6883C9|nr:type VI secretion system protein TssR domain-containing protein [Chryseobacterium sp. LJ668]MBW8524066.1 VWA domain-containing protein [Chryseobacterium sp. LJ668]QYK17002.1 VWA domain-containing protein [Chryseobacterium sp. LJ668]
MKNKFPLAAYYIGLSVILTGCQVKLPSKKTPEPKQYGQIDNAPVIDGFSKKSVPWIAISDRSRNTAYLDKSDEKSYKEVKFLEPLMVLKHRDGMVKVAEYIPDALMKKVSSKSIKTYGWIPESDLLLWSNSLKSEKTGYPVRVAVVPNSPEVIRSAERYYKNDSIMVFNSPSLIENANVKIPNGQMVYVYKQAENNKRFLVGKKPSIDMDSIGTGLYGWVSSDVISAWGERSAIKIKNTTGVKETTLGIHEGSPGGTDAENRTAILLTDVDKRPPLENIFPVTLALNEEAKPDSKTKYFTNVLDYSKNFVYNVLGEPIYFDRYREITEKNKSANIVFVLDVSVSNTPYTPIVKSLLQDLQLRFEKPSYFNSIKYGVVLYKNNPCGENVVPSVLSKDYSKITSFIDEKINEMNCQSTGGNQPVNEGLIAAGNLLSELPDETNIVITIGTSANQSGNMYGVINSLTQAQAKVIMFQTSARSADTYNDFVLMAENIVTNTAKNVAELKKQKIINQSDVLTKNNFNLVEGDAGFYSLDFPKQSMAPGFVIFPKKGDITAPGFLKKSVDSLIAQVTLDNEMIDKSLNEYFHSSVGAGKTDVDFKYKYMYPGLTNPVPAGIAAQLINYGNPFLVKGYIPKELKDFKPGIEKGILISETEYDQLKAFYSEVYEKSGAARTDFKQARALREYIKLLKKYNPTLKFLDKGELYEQPMSYAVGVSTGFDNSDEEKMSNFKLKGWKKSKIITNEEARSYFKSYKDLAERMLTHRNNPAVKIKHNGQEFYWLNEYFMPTTLPVEAPEYTQH